MRTGLARGRPLAPRPRVAATRRPPRAAAGSDSGDAAAPTPTAAHVNALQSALLRAVADQDYAAAAVARDALAAAVGGAPAAPADWQALGVPPWLADRAARLGYPFPTDVQRRAVPAIMRGGRDVVILSQTGSGKTLAFLMPALAATLPVDPAGWTPPPDGPRAVVVVPTRDLGVQVALLAYRLLGGSMASGSPGAADNMFNYQGPKNAKVRGVLDESEALRARAGGDDLASAALVIGLPHLLTAAVEDGKPPLGSGAAIIVVDEADAVVETHGPALATFLTTAEAAAALDGRPRPDLVLVGASAAAAAARGAEDGWVRPQPEIVLGGGVDDAVAAPLLGDVSTASTALPPVPAGVAHRVVVVPRADDELPALARLLRASAAAAGADAPPPRTVVFAPTPAAAVAAADALRSALWNVHRVSLLLPDGREPVRAVAAFRDGDASLLVATPPAARGLDLPCVDAVACLGPPADPADYLHRAGRAGRLGPAAGGGSCTWVVADGDEAARLETAAASLGVALERVDPPPPPAQLGPDAEASDAVRRGLEDIFWTREAADVDDDKRPDEREE